MIPQEHAQSQTIHQQLSLARASKAADREKVKPMLLKISQKACFAVYCVTKKFI